MARLTRRMLAEESGELRINWGVGIVTTVLFIGAGIALVLGLFGGSENESVTLPLGIFFIILPFALITPALLIIRYQKGRRDRLEKGGIPATARVLSLQTTGSEFGQGNFGSRLDLEITPSDGKPYNVRKRTYLNVAEMAAFQPGAILPIILDPKNRKRFIFGTTAQPAANARAAPASWGFVPGSKPPGRPPPGSPAGPPAQPATGEASLAPGWPAQAPGAGQFQTQFLQGAQAAQLLQSLGLGNLVPAAGNIQVNMSTDASVTDLSRARQAGTLPEGSQMLYSFSKGGDDQAKIQRIIDQCDYGILAGGQTAEAIILQVEDLGIRVAGNNPAMKMRVEVRPEGRAPFEADVSGFVSEVSVHKLEVGKKLLVKFDPADVTRVAILRTAPEEGPGETRIVE